MTCRLKCGHALVKSISLFACLSRDTKIQTKCPFPKGGRGKAKAPILLSPGCSWTSAWLHPALGDASSWFQALPSLFPIPISGAAAGPGCLDPPCVATSSPFEVSPCKRQKKKKSTEGTKSLILSHLCCVLLTSALGQGFSLRLAAAPAQRGHEPRPCITSQGNFA